MQTEDLWAEIIAEMEGRRKLGIETYGVPVTANAAVDWCDHLTSELYDAVVYARAFKQVVQKLQQRIVELEEELAQSASDLELLKQQTGSHY